MKLKPKKLSVKMLLPLVGLLMVLAVIFMALIADLRMRKNELESHINQTKATIELTHQLTLLEKLSEIGITSYKASRNTADLNGVNDAEKQKDEVINNLVKSVPSREEQAMLVGYQNARTVGLKLQQAFTDSVPTGNSDAIEKTFTDWKNQQKNIDDALAKFVESTTSSLNTNVDLLNQMIAHRSFAYLLACALILVFMAMLYMYLTKMVTVPIKQLSVFARDVAAGNFLNLPDLEFEGEIGDLAHSLGDMSNRLKKTYGSLHLQIEEKTAELTKKVKELERQQQRDETILESMGDGLVVTDSEGKVILMNQEGEAITGFTSEESRGLLWSEEFMLYDERGTIISPEKRPMSRALLFKRKFVSPKVYYLRRKNGTKVPVSFSVTPLINQGEVVGTIEVFRDVSSETAVDKAKSEFVSLASHQLRTPISAINWYSEALMHGELGELNSEQQRYMQNIYASNQRMISLVNTLLNISRLELGTFNIKLQQVNVAGIPQSVIEELKAEIKSKKIIVHELYDNSLPEIKTDPDLLRVIFQNLITNAIKYTPKGGQVTVEVSSEIKYAQEGLLNGKIFIKISDTGYGIPKAQQEKVFTKLFRGDNVRQIDTDGTGLGLYIVKSVVDFYEGEVWFESAENLGTQFYITLPVQTLQKDGVTV